MSTNQSTRLKMIEWINNHPATFIFLVVSIPCQIMILITIIRGKK